MPAETLFPFEKAACDREVRMLIGCQLKAHYDLAEPISDRLAALLERLAQQDGRPEERAREKATTRK